MKDRKCYTPCPGDGNYICGAPNMTTIYRTNGINLYALFGWF